MSESESKPNENEQAEATFFDDGAPVGDDYVDPDLVNLPRRPAALELVLVGVIMVMLALYAYLFRVDFLYYFAEETPAEIGAVTDLTDAIDENPDYLMQYGSNVYVSLSGIPTRASETDNLSFVQLVGAPIFVERPNADAEVDPRLRNVRPRVGPFHEHNTRYVVEGSGRLLHYSDVRSSSVFDYYSEGYGIWFCGQELSPELQQFRRMMREELTSDLRESLERAPTEEEIEERFEDAFGCQQGFLFQLDKKPADQLPYVVAYCLFGLMELFGLFYFVRWFRLSRAAS